MSEADFLDTVIERPPEGWTLGSVDLHLFNPEERITVDAWRRGPFAIHYVDGIGARLTHAPTGLKIWTFVTMDRAAEAAEEMEVLTDWGAITKKFKAGSDLYPKVKEVCTRIDATPLSSRHRGSEQ